MSLNNENLDIPQPDPAWDYYPLWHSLHHIKAKIDVALKLMSEVEITNLALDKQLREMLDSASDKLIEIVNQFPDDEE